MRSTLYLDNGLEFLSAIMSVSQFFDYTGASDLVLGCIEIYFGNRYNDGWREALGFLFIVCGLVQLALLAGSAATGFADVPPPARGS